MADTLSDKDVERPSESNDDTKNEKDLPNPYEDEDNNSVDIKRVSSPLPAGPNTKLPPVHSEAGDFLGTESIQRAVKDLQEELGEFLAQHIAKTLTLQISVQQLEKEIQRRAEDPLRTLNRPRRPTASTGYYDTRRDKAGSLVSPGSTGIGAALSHDPDGATHPRGGPPQHLLSRLELDSLNGGGGYRAAAHVGALDKFLGAHLQNLQGLQDTLHRAAGSSKRQDTAVPSKQADLAAGASAYGTLALVDKDRRCARLISEAISHIHWAVVQ